MRNLLVRVGADISGMTNGLNKASKQLGDFGSRIDKMFGGIKGQIAGALAGIGGALAIKEGTQDAIKYEALMGTLGESMGKSRQDFIKWQKTVGSTMGFSKIQGAELANTLSLNFKKIATDSEDLVNKTTKMMEIAGVIANKRGMLMSEVSDRIRSAMNQEADGADELGVNVRIAAVQQSKAYKEMADGKPWDKLSENMRKTILYEHILEQVSTNMGETLQNNTQLKMANFTAALMDVRLALGQAFLPILSVVLPVLTAFMRKLESAFQYVSSFMRGLFGIKADTKGLDQGTQSTQKQAKAVSGLGDAVEKTAKKKKKADKEAKRGVAGFDEVNVLADANKDTGDGGGGGGAKGGGAEVGAIPDMGLPLQGGDPMGFEEIKKKAAELGAKLRTMWEPIGKALKTAWEFISSYLQIKFAGLKKFWKENGAVITKAFDNVMKVLKPIFLWLVKFVWKNIKGLIDGVIQFFEGLIKFFSGVFTGNWGKAWEGVKDMFFGAFLAIMSWLNLSFVGGIKKLLLSASKSGIRIFADLGKGIKSKWDEMWTGVRTGASTGIANILSILKTKFDDMVATIYIVGDDMLKGLTGGFAKIGDWFKTNVIDNISLAFTNGRGAVSTKMGELWTSFKGWWSGVYTYIRDNVLYKIRDAFVSYKTAVTDKAKDVWDGIKGKFSGIYYWIRDNVIYKIRDVFVNYKRTITDKAKDIWDGVKEKFSGIYGWFKTNVINKIVSAFNEIKSGFSSGLKGGVVAILNTGIRTVNSAIKTLNAIFTQVSKVVPGTIPKIPSIKEVRLAKGGITNGPVRALIGEAGREVVSPLDELKGMIATAVMSAMQFQGGASTGGDIVLNLDGRQFARIVTPHIQRENKRLGKNVKLNSI